MEEKVNYEYKRAFNLGYQIAKELGLKAPMFKSESQADSDVNPMQAGMLQCINEISLSKVRYQDIKSAESKIDLTKITKGNIKKGNKGIDL